MILSEPEKNTDERKVDFGSRAARAAIRSIVFVSPGGLTGGGGMGSVTRAMHAWWQSERPQTLLHVLDPHGDRQAWLWPLFFVRALLALCAIRFQGPVDVVHIQVSQRSSIWRKGVFVLLAKAMGSATVLHHHGSEFVAWVERSNLLTRSWTFAIARRAGMNVVLGEATRRYLVDVAGVPESRVVVRFNAVPDILDDSQGQEPDPWHLLIVANLSPRKGVSELLQSVAALAKEGHPVQLTLAGGGEVDRYVAEAKALGIAHLCRFCGWLPGKQVAGLINSHGALVLPSHNEGMPMAILEALSARLPVIATPVGAIPEVLQHDENCLFVPPGQVPELTDAIRQLSTDEALRQHLAGNGRRLFEEKFDLDPYMQRMASLYLSVLDR